MSGPRPSPATLFDVASVDCHRITSGDTVRLAVVRPPASPADFSVSFEIWDEGGAQPPNTHPSSTETFWFLRGAGVAVSDGIETSVSAGQFLVLPAGSVHHIRNTGPGRLYAVTTMIPDDGFAGLIAAGPSAGLDAEDLDVLRHAVRIDR